jgi:hypothetical protein
VWARWEIPKGLRGVIKMLIKDFNNELRKAGVAVYSAKSTVTRVGPVHSSRRKLSTTQNAGIEIYKYADNSGYEVRYTNGWKNTEQVYTDVEIQDFINKAVEILNSHNIGRVDVKVDK